MRQTKRVAAALLALCLVVGILPVTVFGTEDSICPHHETHTAECGYLPAVAEVACDMACVDTDEDGIVDHVEGCAYAPAQEETLCTYVCKVCGIQALIDALPEEVTAENSETVTQQIAAIDEAKTALSAEELALVDFTKYDAACAALTQPEPQDSANEFIVTTEDELIAAIDEANARAAALAEGETMEQMTIRLANDIILKKYVVVELIPGDALFREMTFLRIDAGANVHLTSVEGQQYTLKPDNNPADLYGKQGTFMLRVSGQLKVSNLILDCNGSSTFATSAIQAENGGHVTICDGTVVTGYGGAYLFSAALSAWTDSTLIMEGGEIRNNNYTRNPGESVSTMGLVHVKESTFIMNGGKIYNNTMSSVPVWNELGGGSGIIGAVAYGDSLTKVIINGGIIENNNFIEGTGGAICGVNIGRDYQLEVTVNGGIIRNNTAMYGGAIAMRSTQESNTTKLTINGGEISGNSALGSGGILAGGYVDFIMEDGIISGNSAKTPIEGGVPGEGGGGITIKGGATGVINGGKITNNYSDLAGGGILVFYMSELTVNGGEISGNEADAHGGGITVADAFSTDTATKSILTVNGGKIVNNTANSIWTDTEHQSDPFAPGGGGVYLHGNCEMYINGGEVSGNKALNYGSGGGIYCCFGGYVEMNNGYIENNTAAKHGGGVYVDGTNSYEGYIHEDERTSDDAYGTGAVMILNNGRIGYNTAMMNGGGLYISGQTVVTPKGENTQQQVFRGGLVRMNGGIITANTAMDAGGGVYLEAGQEGEYSACFYMTDGIMYFNVAGENGNTSSGAKDAGAELFAEGGNASKTCFTVTTAEYVTAYVQNPENIYVPEADRGVWFIDWYEDYSDQDPVYGKGDPATWETGRNTGRYRTSRVMDRIVYTPSGDDRSYEALILDWSTELKVVKLDVGEVIKDDQTYYFTVTLDDLPESFDADSRFPIETSGSVAGDTINEMENGQKYMTFGTEGEAAFTMKKDDVLTIYGLEPGTKFTITEADWDETSEMSASVVNAKEPAIDTQVRKVSGMTNAQWRNEPDFTRTDVIIETKYPKVTPPEETEPSDPSETTEPSESTEPSTSETTAPPSSTTPTRPADGTNPGTGDYLLPIWALLLLMSGMFLAALVSWDRKCVTKQSQKPQEKKSDW